MDTICLDNCTWSLTASTTLRCQRDTQCVKGYLCAAPVNGSTADEFCAVG